MNKLIGILLISIVLSSCKKEDQITYDLVIENGNIIDIVTGAIEKQTIYINDGRIVKLSNPDNSKAFKSEIVLDGTDKFILPGFWDNHVHFRGGDSLIQANKDFLKSY